MTGKWILGTATSVAAIALAAPASAAQCGELAGMAIDNGMVTSAELIPAGAFKSPPSPFGPPRSAALDPFADLPSFCRVQITLTPTRDSDIKVEAWLPAQGWNRKFVGVGNGVWAGTINYGHMGKTLARGYAVVATDTGHTGNGLTAEWAVGHPEKLIDFAYRAVHLMTVTGKQAVRAFYGEDPAYSLWNSCSTGGRQGLMAARRYPEDYDAISAMAPANPMTALMTQTMWTKWATARKPGAALTPADLGLVHQGALKQCDALDGLADGIISRPATCNFNPAELVCKAGQTEGCLSTPQAEAMEAIYRGVTSADGRQILPGFPKGSEMQLAALTGGTQPFPVAYDYFHLLTFGDQSDWDWTQMDYTQGLHAARSFGGDLLDAPYDGLGPFFARGGKLLLSHGWADGLIPANNTLAFYQRLYPALPLEQAQGQLRLFMAPGMDHCSGGEGPNAFDTLGTIDTWAASGIAPHQLIAVREPSPMPNAPVLPPMSRPLCPYPMVTHYDGEGDPNLPESFSCAAAEQPIP